MAPPPAKKASFVRTFGLLCVVIVPRGMEYVGQDTPRLR
jgi:hypothetical protein